MKWLVLVSLVACAEPPRSVPDGTSVVEVHDLPAAGPAKVDLLIYVDDTAAMAPYHTRLPQLARAVADSLGTTVATTFDLRLAVTSNDGLLRVPRGSAHPWLETRLDFTLARTSSFDGLLADALAPLMYALGTSDPGPSQPLAAAQRALSDAGVGFARADADLWIATVTATDDASPAPVADYIAWLQARRARTIAVYAMPAPRLDEVQAAQPASDALTASIDADPPGFPSISVKVAGGGLCWHAADVDPVTPRAQYDCTFVAQIDNAPRSLPECTLDTEQLCWDLAPSNAGDGCLDPDALRPRIPGYLDFVFSPAIHVECAL